MRCCVLATLLLGLTAIAAEPPVRVFFGPRPADDPTGLYHSLMRFIDSADKTLYGCIHEVDMVPVAEKLAAKAKAGVDVQIVVEADWWNTAKNTAARQTLQKSKVRVYPDTKKSGLMHNKFLIADSQRVWTGSTNVTETCLLFNPNSSVWIESDKIAANYTAEFEEEREGRFGKKRSQKNKSPFPLVQVGDVGVRTFFSPEDEPLDEIVKSINAAKKSIDIMCFVFSSRKVAEAVIAAHQRGVKVRVLLDNLFSSKGLTKRWPYVPFEEMKKAGISCKYDDEESKLHHKVVILDGQIVIVGSFNLSTNAATENDENVLFLDSAPIAQTYTTEFERLWKYYSGDPGQPPEPEPGDLE